jgi:TetR/AcrR family transcriptional regulator, transcriptional repressor for nem operon
MFFSMKDRRTQIVEAATAIMRRQGYSDTSIDEVIRESGLCGKGHFYHYFKSKEELGYAVLKLQFESFAERGLNTLRDPTVEPIERLTHFIDEVISAQAPGGCGSGTPCGALATEMASQHEGFRQLVDSLFQRWADQIEAVLWEARPRLNDDVDTARLARFIVATLAGARFMSRLKGDEASAAGIATELKRSVRSYARQREPEAIEAGMVAKNVGMREAVGVATQ